jgi:hypothetical protein
MKPLRFIRTKVLGVSDKDLSEWTDADYAHYVILQGCLIVASVVGVGGAVAVEKPLLIAIGMLAAFVCIWQFVFSILAWNIYRAQKRRPPPRP